MTPNAVNASVRWLGGLCLLAGLFPWLAVDASDASERVLRGFNTHGMLLEALLTDSGRPGRVPASAEGLAEARRILEADYDENELIRQLGLAIDAQLAADDLAALAAFVDSPAGRETTAALRGRPMREMGVTLRRISPPTRLAFARLKDAGIYGRFSAAISSPGFRRAFGAYWVRVACASALRRDPDVRCAEADAATAQPDAPPTTGWPPSRLIPVWRSFGACRQEPGERCVEWLLRADPSLRIVLLQDGGSLHASLRRRDADGRYALLMLMLPVAVGADGSLESLHWTEIVDLAPAGDGFLMRADYGHGFAVDPAGVICTPVAQQRIPAIEFVGVAGRRLPAAEVGVGRLEAHSLDGLLAAAASPPAGDRAAASREGCGESRERRRLRPSRISVLPPLPASRATHMGAGIRG